MEIKNMFQSTRNKNTDNTWKYVPSSSEKKRAIMMYLFFGIMVSITKKEMNSFEYYHLKQSSGRWILFLLVLVFDIVLLLLPIFKYFGLIQLIILLWTWIINVKQARGWKYFIDKRESPLALFSWVGTWFIDLFEIGVNIPKTNPDDISNSIIGEVTDIPSWPTDIEVDLDNI